MSEVELIEAAITCHSEGKLREADALYGEFLNIHPQHPDALHLKGVALFQLNQAVDAEPLLRKAIAINADEPDYHSNLGLVLQALGQRHAALESFKIAVALQPDFRDALINLARLELKLKLPSDAASTFRRIVGKDETDTTLLREFVAALIDNSELPEAEILCRQILALDATNVESLVSLGHIQQVMNSIDEAEKTYLTALKLDPGNVRAVNNLGTVHMSREQREIALEWFLKAIRLDNKFVEAYFNAGVAYQEIGELDLAENYFNAAISRNKDLPRAYRYLSEIYRARGKSDLQQKTLMKWLDASPDSATAKHLLAASRGERGVLRASDDFIREEFDGFADSFNEKLEKLDYTTPDKLIDLLGRQDVPPNSVPRALDAGCGTGLCGHGISRFASEIVGVDLSSKMLEQASDLNVYSELVENELVAYMCAHPKAFNLIVSADTLVYFGDMAPVFAGARTTLSPRGWFAFSVELMNQEEQGTYQLQDSGRYRHAESYVESCLQDAGFRVIAKEETSIRKESLKTVTGLLFVARRKDSDAT